MCAESIGMDYIVVYSHTHATNSSCEYIQIEEHPIPLKRNQTKFVCELIVIEKSNTVMST